MHVELPSLATFASCCACGFQQFYTARMAAWRFRFEREKEFAEASLYIPRVHRNARPARAAKIATR